MQLDAFIEKLVTTRKSLKYTQEQTALLAGISRRALVDIEAGGNLNFSTFKSLCFALDVEIVLKSNVVGSHPTLDDVNEENRRLFFG